MFGLLFDEARRSPLDANLQKLEVPSGERDGLHGYPPGDDAMVVVLEPDLPTFKFQVAGVEMTFNQSLVWNEEARLWNVAPSRAMPPEQLRCINHVRPLRV